MNEVVIQGWITRAELSLGDLQLVDDGVYRMHPVLEASTVTYDRLQAQSRFVDGAVTVMRRKNQGTMQVAIDVIGSTSIEMQNRKATLINAFSQKTFEFYMQLDTALYGWRGECADCNIEWEQVRIHNKQMTVTFDFPNNPQPIYGPA